MGKQLKVLLSVSSDLSTDQRVQKVCNTLLNNNYDVLLVGREKADSINFNDSEIPHKRFNLWFNKGALFYANLNVRLFFKLLFSSFDIVYANDLDTLPANFIISKLKRKPLIYDSHEYFTEVPELTSRATVKKTWLKIEQLIVPRLKYCITVTASISEIYTQLYQVPFHVMRNFPFYSKQNNVPKEKVIIYQGALNVGRGLEELIAAMPNVNATLWIAGGGDIEKDLLKLTQDLGLEEKVVFLGKLSPTELKAYTLRAKIGVSLEHNLGMNYTLALPNKVFDYLHCATPVLFSNLIEVKKILETKAVGQELLSYDSTTLANQLNDMLVHPDYQKWQQNCIALSAQLSWQHEEKVLLRLLKTISENEI